MSYSYGKKCRIFVQSELRVMRVLRKRLKRKGCVRVFVRVLKKALKEKSHARRRFIMRICFFIC